jgi:translocation and assembly module TamB
MKLLRQHPRLRRVLLWGTGALILLLVLVGAGIWFLLATQGGTEFLFTRLGALMPGTLEVGEIHGPLRGPLDIRGLAYKRDGLEMHVDRVQLRWRLRDLLSRQLDIERLHAQGIRIIPTPTAEKEEPTALPDINLGFNILVRDAQVRDLQIGAPGEDPLVIDRIELSTTAIGNQFQIDRFVVRAPLLDGDVSGKFQPQGDYPVDLKIQWRVRPPDMAAFSGRGFLQGTLEQLRVTQTLDAPFPARLNATLLQPLRDLQFDGRVAFSDFNPRLIKADLPDLPARGEIAMKGEVEAFSSSGSVQGRVEQAGGPVAVAYRLSRDSERWTFQQADVTFPGTPTRIDARGLLTVHGEDLDFDAQMNWRNLRWPLRGGAPTVASSRGNATVSGDLERYEAQVDADLTQVPGGEILSGRWTVEGAGNRESFRVAQLAGNLLGGRLAGNGEVTWAPQVRWKATLRGQGIDPEKISAEFPGDLAFVATTKGRLEDAGPYGTVEIPRLAGNLRGQPVAGSAAIQLGGAVYQLSRLDLDWGTIDLAASGRVAPTLDLAWKVAAPNLGIAVPQGGGSLVAQGRVSGPTATPRMQMNAKAEDLIFGTTRAAAADVTADVDLAPDGTIVLDLASQGVRSGEQTISELTVRGRGTRGSHTVTASAVLEREGEEDRLDLALSGGISGTTEALAWNGQIQRLDVRSKLIGTWGLAAPAGLAASQAAIRLSDFCWLSDGARLCADGGWIQAGAWDVDASVADFPLNTFRPYLPEDLVITGDLNGTVQARGSGAALASANVDLRPGPGEIRFPGREGQTVAFPFEQAVVRAQAGSAGAGEATASLVLRDVGNLSARLGLPRFTPGTPIASQPLSGRIDVNLRNLAFVEGFVPEINDLSGALAGGYDLSGTVGSPRFVGRAELQNARVDVPRFGLELREARLSAVGNGTGALTIDGSVRSGPGTLKISGQAGVPSPETPIRLAVQGRRFLASDTDEIHALVSPDLTFIAEGQKAELTGEIVIPEAKVEIEKRGEKGPVKASDDVVFVNATGQEAAPEKGGMDLTARVRFVLGKDIDVAAFGLKAEPTGSVLVIQRPGQVTRATGEVEVSDGTFKAYGQDLTIERGRLIFAGPVNNPAVDLRAFRKADDGTVAGIEARGTLQKPEVTLWSNPTMTQTEQLSYLLMGRPLNRVDPQEGDRLANAATALGIRGGNMLAKQLAARYGLEEARIESDGSLEEASLVVSKYLSPKLYVSFGMGLFEPVNTFRIRYLLSDKWSVQAENSGAATGADALYTIER